MDAIEITGISKKYRDVTALDNVSLKIRKGVIFGLIGPDGAGKTTMFRILATLMAPDGGSVSISGMDTVADARKLRKIIGYMPGRFSLYQDLSVRENLDFYASVFGTTPEANMDNIREIFSQLEPFSDRRAGKLSGGMKQKLALCCALVHNPEILLLDEPTTGVDAVSRKEFWDMLYRVRDKGVTVVVSTPYMDEASRCDIVALIRHGRIIDTGTPGKICSEYPYTLLSVKGRPIYELLRKTREYKDIISCYSFGSELHAAIPPESGGASGLRNYLAGIPGLEDIEVKETAPGIEDCFMQLSRRHEDDRG